MPLDHGHEQNNVGKGSGGVVELTENPAASRIWMVSGPQQARLLKEFEDQFMDGETSTFTSSMNRDDYAGGFKETSEEPH